MFENITRHIDDCLMDLDKRIASGAAVDPSDMQYGDLLAHFAKSLDTHVAMQEAGGYSGRNYHDGSSYRDGNMSRGNSYRDGGSYNVGVRPVYPNVRAGGYSRADRMDEVVQAMSGAMGDMPEDLRREAQRFLTKMNQQM